jgi:hypothetical protein
MDLFEFTFSDCKPTKHQNISAAKEYISVFWPVKAKSDTIRLSVFIKQEHCFSPHRNASIRILKYKRKILNQQIWNFETFETKRRRADRFDSSDMERRAGPDVDSDLLEESVAPETSNRVLLSAVLTLVLSILGR